MGEPAVEMPAAVKSKQQHVEDQEIEHELSQLEPHMRARARSIIERRASVYMGDVKDAIAKVQAAENDESEAKLEA